ncbi:MAG: hypothetical protein JWR69_515 [Pedosphaera sp.]|nr:hypothetical protein [Pedosphaera sp.]
MKRNVLFSLIMLAAGALMAADPSPKDDVTSAAQKLAAKDNYGWKTTVETPGGGGGGGRFRPGPTEGKTEKDGATFLSMTRGDNTIEAVLKGDKGAIKTEDGWKTLAEATQGGDGQPNPGMFLARMLKNFKSPAAEVENLAGKVKELKKAEDAYSGELTEEGAKQLLTFGPRPGGGDGPTVSDAKGSVKFWITDGVLSKFQTKVQGKVSFNGNDRDVDRTTTVEIKDVGKTKVSVPDEAKSKLT